MSDKKTILLQLDSDPQPSVFDRVVAVDAGAEHIFSYGGVTPDNVRDLVYGAMFTRGPKDLNNTAIFIGGSDVQKGEALLKKVTETFFGPLRVSVLLDCGGANTTAAGAVVVASQNLDLAGARTLVLGGTGPVGVRVARLLARQGAEVLLGSRSAERAETAAARIRDAVDGAQVTGVATGDFTQLPEHLAGVVVVIAAGAPGVELLPAAAREKAGDLRLVIDLNAVPPAGIEGVEALDAGVDRGGVCAWGAIGVGNVKMKIHKAALRELFSANDRILDAEEVFEIGLTAVD